MPHPMLERSVGILWWRQRAHPCTPSDCCARPARARFEPCATRKGRLWEVVCQSSVAGKHLGAKRFREVQVCRHHTPPITFPSFLSSPSTRPHSSFLLTTHLITSTPLVSPLLRPRPSPIYGLDHLVQVLHNRQKHTPSKEHAPSVCAKKSCSGQNTTVAIEYRLRASENLESSYQEVEACWAVSLAVSPSMTANLLKRVAFCPTSTQHGYHLTPLHLSPP